MDESLSRLEKKIDDVCASVARIEGQLEVVPLNTIVQHESRLSRIEMFILPLTVALNAVIASIIGIFFKNGGST